MKCKYLDGEYNCTNSKGLFRGDFCPYSDDPMLCENAEEYENDEKKKLVWLPVEKLYPHPNNPRKDLGDLEELTESIKKNGIMQNLTVVKRDENIYRVIIGHRRLAASKLAGLTEVPCVIAEMSEREQLSTMMLENMQRSDLTVYEQAKGFQMMIDLGETVESVSEMSGFSKTTIRRRLKMAELDGEKLKAVSSRQIDLEDFDRLSKIEDVNKRNELLEYIGTQNFEYYINGALRHQEIEKGKPKVMEWLNSISAKELTYNYDPQYEIVKKISIRDYKDEDLTIPKKAKGEQIYYFIDTYGECYIKVKAKKTVKKVSEEERQKAEKIKEAHALCKDINKSSYECRKNFIERLRFTNSKNAISYLDGAVYAILASSFKYASVSKDELSKTCGWDWDYGHNNECYERLIKDVTENQMSKMIPYLIYCKFDDNDYEGYNTVYSAVYPEYQKNYKLDLLYKWLIEMGYEMSDEEKAMQDGTHEVFSR